MKSFCFVEYIRDVVCQRLSTLLLFRSQPLVQRQRNGRAEVFLFLHGVLLSASLRGKQSIAEARWESY